MNSLVMELFNLQGGDNKNYWLC